MGSSAAAASSPSPAFLAAFNRAAGPGNRLRFAEFMQLALYDPDVGYYRANRIRVGKSAGTDFYTATTVGPLFGELVLAAVTSLLNQHGANPSHYEFVELGAEPGGAVLGTAAPTVFRRHRTLRLGDPLELSGPSIIFSNELFDAQPCERYAFTSNGWTEMHVVRSGDQLIEERVPCPRPAEFEEDPNPGYHFDAPRAADGLLRKLAAQPWHGLFVAFDYGKSLAELVSDTSQGTARAYRHHRQSADLLAHPGEQDLTCHVCWDWLVASLRDHRFKVQPVVAQEAFFVQHAAAWIEKVMTAEAAHVSHRKLALMQLLHPAHLGRKFQVLAGWRAPEDSPCTR